MAELYVRWKSRMGASERGTGFLHLTYPNFLLLIIESSGTRILNYLLRLLSRQLFSRKGYTTSTHSSRQYICSYVPKRNAHILSRFISTMETETISSRNIVDLIFRDRFGAGICGKLLTNPESEVSQGDGEQKTFDNLPLQQPEHTPSDKDFVLGWDC